MNWLALLLLLTVCACRKEKGVWSELTPEEQAAVRERALNTCLRDSTETYDAFRDASSGVFTSTSWQRNDAWKHELKNGTTVDTTHDIQVWKQTPTELYLVVTRTVGATAAETYYLRITQAANDDMIEDLQRQVCNGQVSASGTNPIVVKVDYETTVVGGSRETSDTYSFSGSFFAYAATAWNVTRTVRALDSEGKVTSTTNLTSTFTAVTNPTPLSTDPATYGNRFCDIVEPAADVSDPAIRYKVPYVVPEPSGCATTLPGGWDLTI